MSNDLYPLTLEPLVAEQLWSGRPGEPAPEEENLPPGFSSGTLFMATSNSRVAGGPQSGRGLGYLRQLLGADLMGVQAGGDFDGPLPVELKLKRTGESALAVGLTDYSLWFILAAEEDSSINVGFKPGLNFKSAAADAAGDPGRWSEFMPEYPVETGQILLLPKLAPLLLGAGLTVAQIGPPAGNLSNWPLASQSGEGLRLAAESESPLLLVPEEISPGRELLFDDEHCSVTLITTTHLSTVAAPEAATFLWPLAGQGRIRARGPAPVTRIQPGRVIMLPAALGRYAVESGASITYLLIEAS
ncbi:MAG: hypothetical protein LBP55_04300 [Candidatus Adiutrix sp.]|jgi:hypothetical protein|nr:hypothetical protein [Candidatus Adiutrix sp.]